jgi:thioesterase domain-containing protein
MARSLGDAGEQIAVLVMIESYPALRYAPLAQQLHVYARRLRHYASHMMRSPATLTSSRGSRRPSLGMAFTPAMQRVEEAAFQALQEYRPHYYDGRIRFVRAATPLHFPDDPEKVWTKLVRQFEVESVPGDHYGLLTTYDRELARVISRYVRELPTEKVAGSSI